MSACCRMHTWMDLFDCGACALWKNVCGDTSPMLSWCASFQWATIIHCVKINLRQIRCTDCIQGNEIEAALTAFHSRRHDNMIFGLLHYRVSFKPYWEKLQVYSMEGRWVSGISTLYLSCLTNTLYWVRYCELFWSDLLTVVTEIKIKQWCQKCIGVQWP